MPRRPAPVTGPSRPPSTRRRRKCGGTASPLLARAPKGSPLTLQRYVMISPQTHAASETPPAAAAARTLAADLPHRIGQPVTVQGWLHRRRTLKSVTFLVLRDRTGLAQTVLTEPHELAAAEGIPEETVLQITGLATANAQAPGAVELTG